jgi:hypothetical protein
MPLILNRLGSRRAARAKARSSSQLFSAFFSFSGPGSQSHSHPARRQAKGQGSFPYERHDDDSALRSGSPAVPLPLSQENALLETRTPEGQGEPGLLYKYCTLVCMSTSTLAAFFTGATSPNKASPLHYSASSCLSLSLASSRRRPRLQW